VFDHGVTIQTMDDVSLLKKKIEQISIYNLKSKNKDSGEFKAWQSAVLRILDTTFGTNSRQYKDFASIIYYDLNSLTTHPSVDYERGIRQAEITLQNLIEELEAKKPAPSESKKEDKRSSSVGNQKEENRSSIDPRDIFVVHGRNLKARDAMFSFLRSIDLHPIEFNEVIKLTGKTTPYIGEVLDVAFLKAQAILVLMTPDDEGQLKEGLRKPDDPKHETELTGQARLNVIFESGMAMGRKSDRTVIVELGKLRPFSDIGGRHTLKLDNSSTKRQELAQRLESAGCKISLTGTAWHNEGNFDDSLKN